MLATGKTYELRVGKGANGNYRCADFSRRGQLLALIPPTGGGTLMRARGITHGEAPQLSSIHLPVSPDWHAAAFRHQSTEGLSAQEAAFEELAVADGRVIQRFLVPSQPGQPVRELCAIEAKGTQCLAYCPGNDSTVAGYDVLAAGSSSGIIRTWRLQGDEPRRFYENRVSVEGIAQIALDWQGESIYFTTASGEPCCLDKSGHRSLRALNRRDKANLPSDFDAYTVACHPSERLALFAGSGGDVWMVDGHQHAPVKIRTQLGGFIRRVAFLNKGLVAFFGENGTEFWSLSALSSPKECASRFSKVRSHASVDGDRALSGRVFCQTAYVVLS